MNRNVFSIFSLGLFSLSALAADPVIHLNQGSIRVGEVAPQMQIVLERTQSTPKHVSLEFAVPAKESYCAREDTKIVYGPDAGCGTGTRLEYGCREESICRDVQNTCRDADGKPLGSMGPAGPCDINGTHRVCERFSRCGDHPVPYNLSCNHPVRYCAETASRDVVKSETVVLKFVRLDRLKAGTTQRMTLNLSVRDIGGFGAGIEQSSIQNIDLPGSYKIKELAPQTFRISRGLGGWVFDR